MSLQRLSDMLKKLTARSQAQDRQAGPVWVQADLVAYFEGDPETGGTIMHFMGGSYMDIVEPPEHVEKLLMDEDE